MTPLDSSLLSMETVLQSFFSNTFFLKRGALYILKSSFELEGSSLSGTACKELGNSHAFLVKTILGPVVSSCPSRFFEN